VSWQSGIWRPPADQPVRTVCANHPDLVLAEGAVGPKGEVSHGLCEECAAASRAEAQSNGGGA
jgi:hypothetical protein